MPSLPLETKRQAAREVIDILAEIATLLVSLSHPLPLLFSRCPSPFTPEIHYMQTRH